MPEFWDQAFVSHQLMWGFEPTASALLAKDTFVAAGVNSVLLPGFGYGRNARVFLDAGMSVTGIEISETAIELARTKLALGVTIHHGSVTDMPFDDRKYDAVFCFGLIYLLDADARAGLLRACRDQLTPGGMMIFTVISKQFESYGKGSKLGEDWFELAPGLRMFFYDTASVEREFGPYGLQSCVELGEPMTDGSLRPFYHVVCQP